MANEALFAKGTKIWFGPNNIVGADLAANAAEFQAFITNFNESGGENDTESEPVMGGGFVDKEKPQSQKELEFDVLMRHTDRITDFKKIEAGQVISADGAGTDFEVGSIVIEVTTGTSVYYQAYNNVRAVVFDSDFAADDSWRGTLRFKLSPADADGNPNLAFGAEDAATGLVAGSWTK